MWGFLQRMTPESPTQYLAPGATIGPRPLSSLGLPAERERS